MRLHRQRYLCCFELAYHLVSLTFLRLEQLLQSLAFHAGRFEVLRARLQLRRACDQARNTASKTHRAETLPHRQHTARAGQEGMISMARTHVHDCFDILAFFLEPFASSQLALLKMLW